MMPPDRMPSIGVGILIPVGAVYDSHHHWRNDAGELRCSVAFQAGGYSRGHIQGDPAALRELAAALILAADQAEEAPDPAAATRPTPAGVGS